MQTLIAATIQKGEFAAKLTDMLWTAYGGPVKFVGICVLIFVIGVPLLAFLRRLVR